jgi:hypothetical protein
MHEGVHDPVSPTTLKLTIVKLPKQCRKPLLCGSSVHTASFTLITLAKDGVVFVCAVQVFVSFPRVAGAQQCGPTALWVLLVDIHDSH